MCAVDDENLDWVRFCLKNFTDPNLNLAFNQHSILAHAADFASFEICELLIEWRADIKGSNALTIASHMGRADLVILLLQIGADANEMGVASIDDNPEEIEGTALHFFEKGREDILQILLDHGADVNKKDRMGKTVLSRMYASGDLGFVVHSDGKWGALALIILGLTWSPNTNSLNVCVHRYVEVTIISNKFLRIGALR